MFTRPATTPPEVNGFGALRVYCLELAMTDLGRDPSRSESGRASRNVVLLSRKQRATTYRFPVGQISRNSHTIRGSVSPWILSEKHCENLPVSGLSFQKGQLLRENRQRFPTSGRDICEMNTNSRKSWQVDSPTECSMLAFHLYRWNQLKVISLACRLRTRNDIPGYCCLFRLALQT